MSAFDFTVTLITGGCLHAWYGWMKRVIREEQAKR